MNWAPIWHNGDGTFGERSNFYSGIVPAGLAIGDLDGDSDEDVIVIDRASLDSLGPGSFVSERLNQTRQPVQ